MITILRLFKSRIISLWNRPEMRMSLILVMGVIILSTALLSINLIGGTFSYQVGDIAKENIRVPFDIRYKIDSETEIEKRRVAEAAPLVFDRDQSVLLERMRMVDSLFHHVASVLKENPPIGTEDRTFQLAALKQNLPSHLSLDDWVLLELLKSDNPEELRKIINRVMIYIYDRGILEKAFDNPLKLKNVNVSVRTINAPDETDEMSRSLEDLSTLEEIRKDLYAKCRSIAPSLEREQLKSVAAIVRSRLKANLAFNTEETRRRIDESVKSVKPVMGMLKKGQTIVREGDTITTDSVKKINIINSHTASKNINYVIGVFLLQLLFMMIFGYFMAVDYESLFPGRNAPLITFSLVMFFILYAFFVSRVDNALSGRFIFALLLPIPFITMMVAILNSVHIAVMVGIYTIYFSYAISGGASSTIILSFSSSMLGIFLVGDVERRTDFLRGGLVIGIVNALIVVAVGLIDEMFFSDVIRNVELALVNGLISAILVLGVFPLYENLFGVTTKFKLLELSDLNAPIFKKMLMKAPGTYNHSLMVANLAEAACKDIGANYLLARVGGYYHDIGKIDNAGIYIENKVTDLRTKSMTPLEYARLIISHVEKGVDMALKGNLPPAIIDFIREHHGKSTMTYFYHQALELADSSAEGESIVKTDFQYPGPKPHSRETAIVMLADSVEAASRSLQDPTYVKLEGMVKKIIYNKLNEGDLEFSDLTMSDFNRIQKAFLRVLYGIFHTRIEYPEKEETEKLESRVLNRDNED